MRLEATRVLPYDAVSVVSHRMILGGSPAPFSRLLAYGPGWFAFRLTVRSGDDLYAAPIGSNSTTASWWIVERCNNAEQRHADRVLAYDRDPRWCRGVEVLASRIPEPVRQAAR